MGNSQNYFAFRADLLMFALAKRKIIWHINIIETEMKNMAYEQWEREHDTKLLDGLKNAKFTEQKTGDGFIIHYAHLHGSVHTCDGVLYWSVAGGPGGEKIFGTSADNSILNYGRAAVKNNLIKIAEEVIKSASKRLEHA